MDILRQMRMGKGADLPRDGAWLPAQRLIELEAGEIIGADRYGKTSERRTYRNGYMDRQ